MTPKLNELCTTNPRRLLRAGPTRTEAQGPRPASGEPALSGRGAWTVRRIRAESAPPAADTETIPHTLPLPWGPGSRLPRTWAVRGRLSDRGGWRPLHRGHAASRSALPMRFAGVHPGLALGGPVCWEALREPVQVRTPGAAGQAVRVSWRGSGWGGHLRSGSFTSPVVWDWSQPGGQRVWPPQREGTLLTKHYASSDEDQPRATSEPLGNLGPGGAGRGAETPKSR